jgi:peptide/nickel transport system permease protein
LLKRLLLTLPAIVGVITIVFLLLHLIPGDPVEIMLGDTAVSAQKEQLRHDLGLDQPLLQQYGRFWSGVLHGDLGKSIASGESVAEKLRLRYPATLQLSIAALLIAIFISLPLGILAAVKKGGWWDRGSMLFSLIGVSMPNFWLGPLLILLFSYYLGLFPISGREGFSSIILPALTLGMGLSGLLTRMTRSSLLDVIHQEYIRTAQAKGLSPFQVYTKHAFRNALLPIVTIVGLQFGALLAGAIITEKVFSWPGVGLEIVEAIQKRDYPMVQGCVLTIAMTYIAINLLTDLFYSLVDPRVRNS